MTQNGHQRVLYIRIFFTAVGFYDAGIRFAHPSLPPRAEEFLEQRPALVGKDTARPIVVYCALGGVAAQASHTLKKAGYAEVYPIRGGLNGWLSASLPVTTR